MTGADGRRPVVVGTDPDREQRMALSWAADETERSGLPLRLVHAQGTPTGGYRSGQVRPSWAEWNRQPALEVSILLAEGEPAWVLREESRNASLVVVGSWHLSRLRGLFSAASVALPLAAHAACPVVVVPEAEHIAEQPGYFVTGVDGSAHSAAVDLAAEEAALRGARVRALYVWHPPLLGVLQERAALEECRRVLAETAPRPLRGRHGPEVRRWRDPVL
ncbi:hypothetical protein GCM10009601_26640 [Streptomyces thermospinosisporus]|uniref:UspA domain-containing protein n=1 Tax=Streptomyces thermospinosisporus TaxID=161482 RepID=A0ABN1YV67_9ACTN